MFSFSHGGSKMVRLWRSRRRRRRSCSCPKFIIPSYLLDSWFFSQGRPIYNVPGPAFLDITPSDSNLIYYTSFIYFSYTGPAYSYTALHIIHFIFILIKRNYFLRQRKHIVRIRVDHIDKMRRENIRGRPIYLLWVIPTYQFGPMRLHRGT